MGNQYDVLAKLTEASAESPFRKYFEEYTFFRALGDVTGRSVLDVACGTGLYSRRIRQRGASRVVGVDASEGMIAYARHLERESPLGIDYIVQDVATAGDLGVFDVVAATYLLHYAPSKEVMHAMCATLHRALKPGGRLVSICLNPDVNRTDTAYYRPYGFELHSRWQEGDEVKLIGVVPEMDLTISAFYWSRRTYEDALRTAGFRDLQWHAPEVSPEGIAAFGAPFWRAYLEQPHASMFTCVA